MKQINKFMQREYHRGLVQPGKEKRIQRRKLNMRKRGERIPEMRTYISGKRKQYERAYLKQQFKRNLADY